MAADTARRRAATPAEDGAAWSAPHAAAAGRKQRESPLLPLLPADGWARAAVDGQRCSEARRSSEERTHHWGRTAQTREAVDWTSMHRGCTTGGKVG